MASLDRLLTTIVKHCQNNRSWWSSRNNENHWHIIASKKWPPLKSTLDKKNKVTEMSQIIAKMALSLQFVSFSLIGSWVMVIRNLCGWWGYEAWQKHNGQQWMQEGFGRGFVAAVVCNISIRWGRIYAHTSFLWHQCWCRACNQNYLKRKQRLIICCRYFKYSNGSSILNIGFSGAPLQQNI